MSATKKINEYINEIPIGDLETSEALAVSGGNSVRVPLNLFATDSDMQGIVERQANKNKQFEDNIKTNEDNISGHELRLKNVEQNKLESSVFNAYTQTQAATDKAQSDAISELQKHKQVNSDWNATSGVAQILNKPTLAKVATSGSYNDLSDKPTPPSPTSQCVPYSADLDGISDDLGVAWMNTSKTDKKFGHLYKQEIYDVPVNSYHTIHDGVEYYFIYKYEECNSVSINTYGQDAKLGTILGDIKVGRVGYWYKSGEYNKVKIVEIGTDATFGTKLTMDTGDVFYVENQSVSQSYSNSTRNGNVFKCLFDYRTGLVREWDENLDFVGAYTIPIPWEKITAGTTIGGWKDVYDTSTISADISAEVQRATQAESALSTRIDTKADTSTWSDILKSQIDADHTALGTLSGYLTSAKQTDINNAISKAHQQNTDTQLASGVVKVESDKVSFTRPVVANEVRAGSSPNAHLLTKKLDASMLRTYTSFDAMVADKANIPQGAWCAIIE